MKYSENNFHLRLKAYLERKGMSPQEFCIQTGIADGTIRRLIKGTKPSRLTAKKIMEKTNGELTDVGL